MMTTIKTDDLTPAQINALVAVAEGWVPHTDPLVDQLRKIMVDTPPVRTALKGMAHIWLPRRDLDARWQYGPPNFCGMDAQAGPIIDREHIATAWMGKEWAGFNFKPHRNPSGYDGERYIDVSEADADGLAPTRLEAAMRAYVFKRYGDVILTTDKPWLLEAAAS
jgi:hypothetical protein